MQTFINWLDQNSIPYVQAGQDEHATEGWINLLCPWCNTNSFHLGYNTSYGTMNCWKCGQHNPYSYFLAVGLSRSESRSLAYSLSTNALEGRKRQGKLVLPDHLGPLQELHSHYLRARGFNTEELEVLWKIQGIGYSPTLSWRIFIPIHQIGEVVCWTTRSIGKDVHPKYITAKVEHSKIPIKDLVYGIDYCRHSCLITEGPTDVWKIGPGSICTFGMDYSKLQLLQISRVLNRYVCFDNEPEAQKRAVRLCQTLSVLPGKTQRVMIDEKDPGEATPKTIQQLRRLLL